MKNAFQLVVISETALDDPPLAAEDGAVTAWVGDDGAAVAEEPDPGVDVDELELLEQAAIAVTSTRPSAGARNSRRAVELNGIITRP